MTTASSDFDVAVVGAGPSGSRTAELLAKHGFRVALFEKDAEPGRPVHCTGIVSSECFERYALPRSLVIRDLGAFVLRSPSGRGTRIQAGDAPQAHVLDRVALDRLLVKRAVDAGASLFLDSGVDRVQWTGEHVSLRTTTGGQQRTVVVGAAVIATGYGSPLARSVGMTSGTEVISGCQAVVAAPEVEEVEVFTGGRFGYGGYGWLVPWREGFALAGLLTRKHTVRLMDEHLQRLQREGRIGTVEQVFRCRAIPLGLPRHSVADGVIGVGDTIGQVKPTSGGGIYYGLLGADAAAEVLAVALESGNVTASALAPYDKRWRALMEGEIRQGYALRHLLEQLPETVVESLHRLLALPGLKRVLTSTASFDWHSGPLTKALASLQHQGERHSEALEATAS